MANQLYRKRTQFRHQLLRIRYFISITNGVKDGEVSISGSVELVSTKAAAFDIGCALNENNLKITLDGNVKYDGATYAVYFTESEADSGYYKTLPKVNVKGGNFACGDDYILISDTSSVVFEDDEHVLNTKEKTQQQHFIKTVILGGFGSSSSPSM